MPATEPASPPTTAAPLPASPSPHRRRRTLLIGAGVLAALVAVGFYLRPTVVRSFATVSTDDAYVNSHFTVVAPRVAGQVARVLVDDNYRVKKGDLVVELDKEPYQVQVAIKKAMLAAAEADLVAAKADVRALEATLRSQRWKTQHAVEQVNNQVANLKAAVATFKSQLAVRDRAAADFRRVQTLRGDNSVSAQESDAARQNLRVAEEAANQAREQVHQIRVSLGLPPDPPGVKSPDDLTAVPPDLSQTFSDVRTSLGELAQSLARLGLPLLGTNDTPDQVIARFRQRDASGDVDKILTDLIPNAPEVKQSEAKLMQAKQDLAQAELNLRYCDVFAEIDGVVTRRNVNPGNNVQVGQALMVLRSLTEIWVDANFKETQLADLAIGQRVEVYADVYGKKKAYRGRITGFTSGTGSTLALLPAQNATGNFVKVVQRLPVRIEFEDYDPNRDTLFTGLSVVPYVYTGEPPSGPNAGRKVQEVVPNGGGK